MLYLHLDYQGQSLCACRSPVSPSMIRFRYVDFAPFFSPSRSLGSFDTLPTFYFVANVLRQLVQNGISYFHFSRYFYLAWENQLLATLFVLHHQFQYVATVTIDQKIHFSGLVCPFSSKASCSRRCKRHKHNGHTRSSSDAYTREYGEILTGLKTQ